MLFSDVNFLGVILMAVGAIMFSIPHYTATPHEVFDTTLSCVEVLNTTAAGSNVVSTCADGGINNYK